ncbi:MAG: carboxypeptidase regulatory-like domain-containing protein, partial [Ferruginibacter sp.]
MKLKLLLIAAVTLFTAFQLKAQNASKITGQIKDNNGKGIATATIMLHRAKDSSLAKTAISNSAGNYEILQLKPGSYFIRTSVLGMKPTSSEVITVAEGDAATVPAITTQVAPKNLQDVTVTTKKPIVEVKADKTILNVEGTINAVGNDALELLRKSPGVMVDKDDNLSLAGKNGVQVYIDGKPSPLSGADLANYLKSMQSSQIEAIELITNPSAKYEAAGNAGIINIKLKKNKAFGTNGSVNAGYAIGIYSKYNGGLSLNNRNKKTNFFGNYNYNQGINESIFNLYRVLNLSTGDTIFDQTNRMLMRNKFNHNYKVGADYYIDAKSTIGIVVNGNASKNLM